MRTFLAVVLAVVVAVVVVYPTPAMSGTGKEGRPELLVVSEPSGAGPAFIKFSGHLQKVLHDWWQRQGKVTVRGSWLVSASEHALRESTFSGMTLRVERQEKEWLYAEMRIEPLTHRNAVAVAEATASAVIEVLLEQSRRERERRRP